MQLMHIILPKEWPWNQGDYFYMEDEEFVEYVKSYIKELKGASIDEHNQSTLQNPR